MSNERVKRYRLKQKEQGRLKREVYLTDLEFDLIKIEITNIRAIKPVLTTTPKKDD